MASVEPFQIPEPSAPGEWSRASSVAASAYPKQVPVDRAVRERIRQRAWQMVGQWDRTRPLSRQQIEQAARQILADLSEPDDYLGWTMVMVGSAFWQVQVAAVPLQRRLLLLPHCFRSVEKCQGVYTAEQLICRQCGACRLCFFQQEAERLGYQVLIAEGTPIVLRMILGGKVDAILGVACLNSLERALDKILQIGIPCMAVPLWESRCHDSRTDDDWVLQMLRTPYAPSAPATETYLHLLRAAGEIFRPERLVELLPDVSKELAAFLLDQKSQPESSFRDLGQPNVEGRRHRPDAGPVWQMTEGLAYDFLLRGGKHLRPFLTLAAYDAMTGARATQPDGRAALDQWPAAVWQIALAIEVFHKASLIHDDIEDDDPYRYGRPALHREYGVPMALNVGDYLLGLGYRLAAQAASQLVADGAREILGHLAQSHVRLSEGQGAELAWRESGRKTLSPLEVLKIYSLKTAPAFEAALLAGLRMAGPVENLRETLARYSRQLGVAFQIQNDLADWAQDKRNKRVIGTDVLTARPTILWALARQSLSAQDAARLDGLLAEAGGLTSRPSYPPGRPSPPERAAQNLPPTDPSGLAPSHEVSGSSEALLAEVRSLYEKADIFNQAKTLARKHLERAHSLADQLRPPPLQRLLHYAADMI